MIDVTPEEWIARLESGEVEQARGAFLERYESDDGRLHTQMCCLAVLAQMCYPGQFLNHSNGELEHLPRLDEGQTWFLKEEGLIERMPLPSWLPGDRLPRLAGANDSSQGYPIDQIKQILSPDWRPEAV